MRQQPLDGGNFQRPTIDDGAQFAYPGFYRRVAIDEIDPLFQPSLGVVDLMTRLGNLDAFLVQHEHMADARDPGQPVDDDLELRRVEAPQAAGDSRR